LSERSVLGVRALPMGCSRMVAGTLPSLDHPLHLYKMLPEAALTGRLQSSALFAPVLLLVAKQFLSQFLCPP
jgi:hypothetical protein